jgi:hypothetical protein
VLRSILLAAPSASDHRSEGLSTGAGQSLVSFGEDACGHVYVVSDDGPVYRLSETSPAPACPASPPPQPPAPPAGPTQDQSTPAAPVVTRDRKPPVLTVNARRRQRVLRSRTLTLRVACDERCSLIASARVTGTRGSRRPNARTRLAFGSSPRTVRLVFSRAEIKRIRRALAAKRKVVATLRVSGGDAAANYSAASVLTVRITG